MAAEAGAPQQAAPILSDEQLDALVAEWVQRDTVFPIPGGR
eukprot:gene847-4162_t